MNDTIKNQLENDYVKVNGEGIKQEELTPDITPEEQSGIDFKEILTSPTGDGAIDDYLDHALNFNKSHAMARVIRGATGLLGNLNLAIIDIGVGILELFKGSKKVAN